MLRKRFIQVSLLITLMAISHTGFAQDSDGFYVIPIPVPTDQVIEVEVCNGTPIGDVVFTVLAESNMSTGTFWLTNTGYLVEIIGGEIIPFLGSGPTSFRTSFSSLPQPEGGVKGPFYAVGGSNGGIAYARIL
jgi:hypothetical protein